MQAVRSKPLEPEWKDRLDLSLRKVPELYERADDVGDTPHAGAIRTTLAELGVSAVFCVQEVPTIAILSVDDYDRAAIVDLHARLWNQGLASLLLVISGDTVRALLAGAHSAFRREPRLRGPMSHSGIRRRERRPDAQGHRLRRRIRPPVGGACGVFRVR